jgi:hypothetical protein
MCNKTSIAEVFVKRFTFCILLILAFSAGAVMANQTIRLTDSQPEVTLLSQDEGGLTLRVGIDAIDVIDVTTPEGTFSQLVIDGATRSNRIGEPALPLINRLISIPYGCDLVAELVDYNMEEISLEAYGVVNPVIPAQPSLSKSQDPADVPFEFDRALYQKSGYYGFAPAGTQIFGFMRAMRLGLVSMSPVEYDPVNNMLRVYTNLTIRVRFVNPDWSSTRSEWQRLYSPYYTAVYSSVFNYNGQESMLLDDITRYPIKYAIVSARMFEAQLEPFINWKIQRGFNVVVGYTDVIGGTNAAIKTWLRNLYNDGTPEDPAPSFVLLVGDAQQIPPMAYSGHISDLNFCEYTNDNIPEIYYGRFSAQTTVQLQPQIDKTLEYEKYLMPDPSFLGEVTMIAGVDANYAPTYGNGQINYGTDYYFNAAHGIYSNTWLYPASGGNVESAIIQTINDGLSYINYTAHGSHDSWSDPTLTVGNVNSLTNAHKYSLAVGNCCLTNTFGTDYSSPCLGEVFLQAANKGAVGYIGGSNSSYWDEDYWWGVGFKTVVVHPPYNASNLGAYDGIFHDHGEPVSKHYLTNEAINFCGNLAVTQSGSSRIAYYWQIYHLMGDPSVMTYFGVPSANSVVHDAAILFNAAQLNVQAEPGSYVGISQDGALHGVGHVGSSGNLTIDLTPFSGPGVADIVITAQNRIPYISTIQLIAPSGPYVVFDSTHVDDSTGNNNGQVDCGEHIALGVQLTNVGPDPASGVTATLITADSFVVITDNQESFGSIPGNNGVSYRPAAYLFDVSGLAPDEASINFILTIIFSGSDTVESRFALPVHAPVLEYVSIIVDDIGNDNGVLDPGESANLTILVTNSGSIQAVSVQGMLSETDNFVNVVDAEGTFGTIVPSDTVDNGANMYNISAASYCPTGYSVTLLVAFTAVGGYQGAITFPILVGDRAVIYTDDFSTDNGWTGLGGAGEWTLGPATGGDGADSYGEPDPSQDNSPTSDNQVLGNDLTPGTGGDYAASLSQTHWVTSPNIDCSNYNGVVMSFYRWLGVERNIYDHAYFEAYNGTAWIRLFENGSEHSDETSWNLVEYDLSAAADHNASFKIRYGIGNTDGSWQYCGWNIDDILLKGYMEASSGNPELQFSISGIADTLVQGDSSIYRFKIYNRGDAALGVGFTCQDPWLRFPLGEQTVAPLDSVNFDVMILGAGLNPEMYNCTLDYTSNDVDHPSGSLPVAVLIQQGGCSYLPGDINGNGTANGIDVTYGVIYFKGGAPPLDTCMNCPGNGQILMAAGDVNANCAFNGIDLTFYVAFLKGIQPTLRWCEQCPPAPLAIPGFEKPNPVLKSRMQSGTAQ